MSDSPHSNLGFHLIPSRSAADSLSLSTDGHIPPHLWRAAFAYDRAQSAKDDKRATVRRGKIRLKTELALELMTRTIALAATRGSVERADFERLGLMPDQIDALAQEALARAVAGHPGLASMLAESPA